MKHRINSEPKKMSCYSALSIEKYSCVSYRNRRKPSCKVQETILGVTGSRGRDCFSAACRQGTCSNLLCFWHSWIPLFPDLGSPHRTKHFVFHTLLAGQYIWQSGESSLFMWTATLHLSQQHVTVYPKLIGCLPLNWLKPLALKSLVHFMYFSISKEKRWNFHKEWQKLFMKCNFCESQFIKIMRHCVVMNTPFCSVLKDKVVWKYIMILLFWKLQEFFHYFFQNSAY